MGNFAENLNLGKRVLPPPPAEAAHWESNHNVLTFSKVPQHFS